MNNFPEITIPFKDKVLHAMFYFGFVIFWYKSISYFQKNQLSLLIIAIAFGVLIELGQKYFTSTRSYDILDIIANTFGAIMATLILRNKQNAH